MNVWPIKVIPLFIEGNKDNLNIFEVEDFTFNGGEVKSMGRNAIGPCTREEWMSYKANIVEAQSSIDQLNFLLEESSSGTQSDMKEIKRDVQWLLYAPAQILRINGGEEYSTGDGGRGALP